MPDKPQTEAQLLSTRDVLLREYDIRSNEIRVRLEANDRLLNYIIAMGVAAAASFPSMYKSLESGMWLVGLGVVFFTASLVGNRLQNEIFLATNAAYIEQVLRPHLTEITGTDVLRWESFLHSSMRARKSRLLGALWRVAPLVYLCPMAAVPFLFAFCRYNRASVYEWALFAANVAVTVWLTVAAIIRNRAFVAVAAGTGALHQPNQKAIRESFGDPSEVKLAESRGPALPSSTRPTSSAKKTGHSQRQQQRLPGKR